MLICLFLFFSLSVESGSEGDQIRDDVPPLYQRSHRGLVLRWGSRIQQTVRQRVWISSWWALSLIGLTPRSCCHANMLNFTRACVCAHSQVGPGSSSAWSPSCFSPTCASTGFTASYITSLFTRWARPWWFKLVVRTSVCSLCRPLSHITYIPYHVFASPTCCILVSVIDDVYMHRTPQLRLICWFRQHCE